MPEESPLSHYLKNVQSPEQGNAHHSSDGTEQKGDSRRPLRPTRRRWLRLYLSLVKTVDTSLLPRWRKWRLALLCFMVGALCAVLLTLWTQPIWSGGSALNQALSEERAANAALKEECSRLNDILEQNRLGDLLTEREPLPATNPQAASARTRLTPPPLTLWPSSSSPSSASHQASLNRLANPGVQDWKERYQYAALQYNKVVADYNKLRKQYLDLVGNGAKYTGRLVTGTQFYHALRQDTRAEMRKLDERYSRGGLRSRELKELEASRDEMRHRDLWLKKMANRLRID